MDRRQELSNLLKQKYTKKVYIDIFNILNEEKYSSNSNGIFFNLKDIDCSKINKCIEYIESLSFNIEDHMKNLSIREKIEEEYKNTLGTAVPKVKKIKSTDVQNKEDVIQKKEIISPFVKKTYKSKVFKRLDNIMLGKKKKEEKKIKKSSKSNEEETIEEDLNSPKLDSEDDLFGDDDDESKEVIDDDNACESD